MTTEAVSTERSILMRLKSETLPEHEAIEGVIDLMSDGLTLEDYQAELEKFWGFMNPVEQRLAAVSDWSAFGINWNARRKAAWIEDDLRKLGLESVERLPVCRDLPELNDQAAGFGCLYVLEGSTLGGQFISRRVREVLGVTPETGGRFFHGYGDRTGSMWRELGVALTAFATDRDIEDRMIAAAIATFQKFRLWFQAGAAV